MKSVVIFVWLKSITIKFRKIIQMKIQPNPIKLQLEVGSSDQITANIKFNRKEIGATGEESNKAENNLGNLPNDLH